MFCGNVPLKGKHQLTAELKDKEINSLKEELKLFQVTFLGNTHTQREQDSSPFPPVRPIWRLWVNFGKHYPTADVLSWGVCGIDWGETAKVIYGSRHGPLHLQPNPAIGQ